MSIWFLPPEIIVGLEFVIILILCGALLSKRKFKPDKEMIELIRNVAEISVHMEQIYRAKRQEAERMGTEGLKDVERTVEP